MALSPQQIRMYWERGIFGAGDAAQTLVKLACDSAGLTLYPGQRYIVATLIQVAFDAMDDHNARREQGMGPIDRPNERDRARDHARRNETDMALKLRNPRKPTPAPAPPPPPPPVVDDSPATPAEVIADVRVQLGEMRDHTGNHHIEALVDGLDRSLEALQEMFTSDDE